MLLGGVPRVSSPSPPPRWNAQVKAIYVITGGKQPDKKVKNASKFETKKLQIQARIDNIDKVGRRVSFCRSFSVSCYPAEQPCRARASELLSPAI